jgi:hypothetical protein
MESYRIPGLPDKKPKAVKKSMEHSGSRKVPQPVLNGSSEDAGRPSNSWLAVYS